jgi:hypothetical protein
MPTWLGQFDSFSNYKENDVKNKSKLLSRWEYLCLVLLI